MNANKLENYDVLCKIGEGAYGVVFKAIHKPSKRLYALKRVRISDEDEGVPRSVIREITILKDIDHPNIVRLHSILNYNKYFYLVLELSEMDLKKYLTVAELPLKLAEVKLIVKQLLKGLAELHKKKIMHRDLKPQNILVDIDEDLRIKIGDLGLARTFNLPTQLYTTEVTTLWYRAPEVLLGSQKYNEGIDIWSLGCIIGELIKGKPIFPGKDEKDQLERIIMALGYPKDWEEATQLPNYHFIREYESWDKSEFCMVFPELDAMGLDFLAQLFIMDPKKRVSAQKALEHRWLTNLG